MDYLNSNFHVILYDGLKLLGFEKYLKNNRYYNDVEFNSSMFLKGNQKAFEVVTYFLFSQLKNSEYLKVFRGCYPCLDKTHESDFRKGVISLFKKLEKDACFNHKFLPGVICNPGGDSFVGLYVVFINYIHKKTLISEKIQDLSIDELLLKIDTEKLSLMNKIDLYDKKLDENDESCEYFYNKFNSCLIKENDYKTCMKEIDNQLVKKYNTDDYDELFDKLKHDLDLMMKHKIKLVYEDNKDILETKVSDLEERVFDLKEIINDESKLPVDFNEIKNKFEEKLKLLDQNLNKENFNLDETMKKLDLKNFLYSSSNRILIKLFNNLEKNIDLLKKQSKEKKKQFFEREDIQNLFDFVKSKVNVNPPNLVFEPKKYLEKKKSSVLDLTHFDQTLINKTVDDDFNYSINLAEMSGIDFIQGNEESFFKSPNNTKVRISMAPFLPNIKE